MCIEDDCPEDISSRRSFLSGATATLAGFALLSVADEAAKLAWRRKYLGF